MCFAVPFVIRTMPFVEGAPLDGRLGLLLDVVLPHLSPTSRMKYSTSSGLATPHVHARCFRAGRALPLPSLSGSGASK